MVMSENRRLGQASVTFWADWFERFFFFCMQLYFFDFLENLQGASVRVTSILVTQILQYYAVYSRWAENANPSPSSQKCTDF